MRGLHCAIRRLQDRSRSVNEGREPQCLPRSKTRMRLGKCWRSIASDWTTVGSPRWRRCSPKTARGTRHSARRPAGRRSPNWRAACGLGQKSRGRARCIWSRISRLRSTTLAPRSVPIGWCCRTARRAHGWAQAVPTSTKWSEQTGDGYSAIARSIASSPRDPEEPPLPRASRLTNRMGRWLASDHAHPEHRLVSDIDVVFADEVEPAAVVDPKDSKTRWHGAQGSIILHKERHDVCGDQQAPARVDMKSATVNTVRLDVLDQTGLAGRRVDR